VNYRDVWMTQCRNRTGFANEARSIMAVSRREKLDGNAPCEVKVLSQIDGAHSTFA
jgi:hypothetical protein